MKLPKGITPRTRKGYSQRDASNALGISKRTLENWEQERATPAPRLINRKCWRSAEL